MILDVTHRRDGSPIQHLTIGYKASIGIPPGNGSNFPQRLDHFRITAKSGKGEWVEDADFTKLLSDKYSKSGNPLREFEVILLSDDPEQVFRTSYEWWSKTECKCRGNGLDAQRRRTALTDSQKKEIQPTTDWLKWTVCGNGCPQLEEGLCKPSGNLYFMFPDKPIMGSAGFFHTSGYESIKRLSSSIEMIRSITGGRLRGIPLSLVIRPYKARYDDNGTVKTSVQFAANLEFRATDHKMLVPRLIEEATSYRKMLAAANDGTIPKLEVERFEEREEAEMVSSEFYPDTSGEDAPPSTAGAEGGSSPAASAADINKLFVELNIAPARQEVLNQALGGDGAKVLAFLQTMAAEVVRLQLSKEQFSEIMGRGCQNPDWAIGYMRDLQVGGKPADAPAAKKTTKKKDKDDPPPPIATTTPPPPTQQTEEKPSVNESKIAGQLDF